MKKSYLTGMIWAGVLIAATPASHADLIGRLPATPGGTDFQAYYDDQLNITWLADANLAASNTFGVAGIGADGSMSWPTANLWIAAMNTDGGTGYLGLNDWRLPTTSPIDGSDTFNTTLTNNATSDVGYADGAGWLDPSGNPVSEMGHMYYVNLGNLGLCEPNGGGSATSCVPQPGSGLSNTDPFSNLLSAIYWADLGAPVPGSSWLFNFGAGDQDWDFETSNFFAWAVRPGDVTSVLEPSTLALLGIGLAGMGLMRRRRKV